MYRKHWEQKGNATEKWLYLCIVEKGEKRAQGWKEAPKYTHPLPADPSSTKHPTKDRAEEAETKALWLFFLVLTLVCAVLLATGLLLA